MNKYSEKLLKKINNLTKNKPIIYFARDAERALGLENLLNNFYIVCIEESYLTQELYKKFPEQIFCTETEGIVLAASSTLNLVSNQKIQEWIKLKTPDKFYAMLFQFNNPTYIKLQNLGATVINNKPELNRIFEDKLSQFKILNENSIWVPKSEIMDVSSFNYETLAERFGAKFVIQLNRAHTGLGTFIISSTGELEDFKTNFAGNIVKVSEFITGEPYTVNGCITANGVFINGLQYQITGYSELTPGKGSTVGNDWSYAKKVQPDLKNKIYDQMQKIGELMKGRGFRGMFGIDIIISGLDIYVIEINARQTANIPMQTKLEIQQDQTPLELIHIAEFLNTELGFAPDQELHDLEGSQIFLRSKQDNFEIKTQLNSGIYRLQSDNSAFDWSSGNPERKEKVIFIDEEKDKPLIWQKEGYSIDDLSEGGFVLLIQENESRKNKFDEVARMQFNHQIVYNNKVTPWVIEALTNIEDLIR